MRADVIKDCQEITVKAVSFPHQRGTVLYACLPCDTNQSKTGRQIRFIWYLFCWSILRGWKVLPGQTVVSPIERIYQFRWSTTRLAGRNCCWENVRGRPFLLARAEEKYGPLSARIRQISVSMRQGQMNSQKSILLAGSSMHKSFNMP